MKIRFTADSTCDMSAEFRAKYQVELIPLSVELNGKYYKDGVDIFPDDIIAAVNQGANLPKTSALNVSEYVEVFTRVLKDCDAIIHFNIGSGFSSCHQNARLAAEGLPVYCIDTENLSSGSSLLIGEAADMLEAGMEVEKVVEELGKLTKKVDASFILDRLDYLYKGGRCSMVAMLGANVLRLKPCIEVVDGKMGVGKKYRGTYERCLKQYINDRLADKENISTKRVYITHTGVNPEAVEAIKKIVAEQISFDDVFENRAGSTITSHCGENTLGILMVRK
ncbi:MAG: DegV family protein [Clostridia bacterium]|nr:DegV family protein [Clostridia bacterium]